MISFGRRRRHGALVTMVALFYESYERDARSVELFTRDKTNTMIPVFKFWIVS